MFFSTVIIVVSPSGGKIKLKLVTLQTNSVPDTKF